jgi:hypothetical protein
MLAVPEQHRYIQADALRARIQVGVASGRAQRRDSGHKPWAIWMREAQIPFGPPVPL